ncbi:hypothetical protein FRC01_009650, partial [Tulasnella sp. 417]
VNFGTAQACGSKHNRYRNTPLYPEQPVSPNGKYRCCRCRERSTHVNNLKAAYFKSEYRPQTEPPVRGFYPVGTSNPVKSLAPTTTATAPQQHPITKNCWCPRCYQPRAKRSASSTTPSSTNAPSTSS